MFNLCLQEDDDGHLLVLSVMLDLMEKCRHVFLEHFARLGLFARVANLAGPPVMEEEGAKAKDDKVSKKRVTSLATVVQLSVCC